MAGGKALGNLFVRVSADIGGFVKGMDKVGKSSQTARAKLASMTEMTPRMAAGFGVAAAFAAQKLFEIGAATEETLNRFQILTGASQDMAQQYVKAFSAIAGVTESETQNIVGNLTNIAKGAGFAEEAAVKLALGVTTLAGDLGSFNEIPVADVANDIASALTGEAEAMKKYGIVLQAAVVDQVALAKTGKTATSQLTQQERVLARTSEIMRQGAASMGDLVETQGSAARQAATMSRNFRQMVENLAVALLPALGFLAEQFLSVSRALLVLDTALSIGIAKMSQFFAGLVPGGLKAEDFEEQLAELATTFDELLVAWVLGTDVVIPDFVSGLQDLDTGVGEVTNEVAESLTLWEIWAARMRVMQAEARATEEALNKTLHVINQIAFSVGALINTLKNEGGFLKKLSGVLGVAGGIAMLIPGGQLIGAGLLGASQIAGAFQHGGMIPAGQVGLVGEAGPEMVSGPAQITPMDQGGIIINIVTESGRKLVDTIRVKDKRDGDMRRVVRVPLAAVATG